MIMEKTCLSVAFVVLLLSVCCLDTSDSGRWTVEELNDSIYYVLDAGGKPAYLAGVDEGNATRFYYIYEGKDLGREYDDVSVDLYPVNGKPAFLARDRNRSFIVYDGKEYGKDYDYIDPIFTSVGGEITYFAVKGNRSVIVQGEKEFGGEYDEAALMLEINASDLSGCDPEEVRVRYDGKGMPSYWLLMPAFGEVNGELAYVAEKDGKSFVVYGGQEIGKQYDRVYTPIREGNHTYLNPVNGKLTYIAMKDNRTFVVYGGQEIGGDYTINPFLVTGAGGKLVFVAERNNRSFLVCDGEENGKEYDSISSLLEYNGKVAYIASEGNKSFAVYDGIETGKEYDSVDGISVLNGKLAYTVSSGKKGSCYMMDLRLGGGMIMWTLQWEWMGN